MYIVVSYKVFSYLVSAGRARELKCSAEYVALDDGAVSELLKAASESWKQDALSK